MARLDDRPDDILGDPTFLVDPVYSGRDRRREIAGLVDEGFGRRQTGSVSDGLGEFFRNDNVRFELQRITGEEVAPRFELFDELHTMFHRRQILY